MKQSLHNDLSSGEAREVQKIFSADTRHKFHEDFKKKNIAKKLFKADVDTSDAELVWYSILARFETDDTSNNTKVKMFLEHDEEILLFKQMNYAKWRVNRIKERDEKRRLSLKECRDLLLWYQISKKVENKILVTNLGLVSMLMRKKGYNYRPDASEMRAAMNMGLLAAIRGFDVSMGFKFSTYACRAIIQHGNRYIEMKVKGNRIYDKTVIDEYTHPSTETDYDRSFRAEEIREVLDNNYADLNEEQMMTIRYRFAIGVLLVQKKHYTLEEIGNLKGVTKECVRQWENEAMHKLRTYFASTEEHYEIV